MVEVLGQVIDNHTRCIHYHSQLDIIAIKFSCCQDYYPCYQCHLESTNHEIVRWKQHQLTKELVIVCGGCWKELTFLEYTSNDNKCMYCRASFNPKCQLHYDIYFDL